MAKVSNLMRRLTFAAACLLLGPSLSAQIPAQPPGPPSAPPSADGVIIGRTIDGGTGRPVAGALVNLTPAPGGLGGLSPGDAIPLDQLRSVNVGSILAGMRQTITDGQGRFAFTGLARGTFSLAATKPGWSGGGYGQRRPDGTPMPLVLAGSGRVGDVSLELWKNAAIGGTVLDEVGEPIVGVAVRALRRTWLGGRPRFAVSGTGQTDDRGSYRIGGLRPGEYVVLVPQTPVSAPASGPAQPFDTSMIQSMVLSGGQSDPNTLIASMSALAQPGGAGGAIRVGDWMLQTSALGSRLIPPAVAENGRMSAYRTTYYPGGSALGEAGALTLGSSDDRSGIDFQLKPVPVAQVSGTVMGPEGPTANIVVRLLAAGAEELASDAGFESATTRTDANGAFAFLAVPPGQYTARVVRTPQPTTPASAAALSAGMSMFQNAQGNRTVSMGSVTMDQMLPTAPGAGAAPTLWGSLPLSVSGADVAGVSIALRSGSRVSGRAEFEGSSARPTPDQLKRISVVLDRADSGSAIPVALIALGQTPAAQLDDNAQFTTSGAVPGKYFIRAPFVVGTWTLKSALLAGRDLADEPLEIENGDISGVVLTFTDRVIEVSGLVRDGQARPASSGSVVIFPTQAERWMDFGSSPRTLRVARVGPDGRYRVAGLAAGEYLLAAVAGDVAGDWQNPAFLQTLSRTAARVSVGDGEKKTIDIVIR